ncbi:hypothetical protein K8S19_09535 [bacterium]|nr:hypothetical protein [bacterium]
MRQIWYSMKCLVFAALFLFFSILITQPTFASGSPHQLSGYATSGVNPTVVFVVTDQYGNGVQGVPVTVATSAGALDVTANSTTAGGTMTVQQSGGSTGDNITATCAQVSSGSPYTITTATSQNVTSSDEVVFWFDESRQLVNAVAITPANKVITATSNFVFDEYNNTSDYRYLTIGRYSNISQGVSSPAQLRVYPGTYSAGDRIRINETTVSGYDGDVYFSSTQPSYFLKAYAVDGASPTVCAVVTDFNGVGVSGISVDVTASSGNFVVGSGTTSEDGVVWFYQENGSLGDIITATCPNQEKTSPVIITTESSQVLDADDVLFSWYARKKGLVYTAVVDDSSNVLVTSAAISRDTPVDINNNPDFSPTMGTFIDQTSAQPAVTYVGSGTFKSGDLLRIYQTTIYRHPAYYHSQIKLPASESQYLLAFASGGLNPDVWAVVTDESGNAVKGVPITFSMPTGGTLEFTSAATSWNGVTKTSVSGETGLGNTITVSSVGLGEIIIYTSNSKLLTATDRVYGWYDPETHKFFGAVVDTESNIMLENGTTITDRNTSDETAGNNVPTYSAMSSQTDALPCVGHIGYGTIEAGDYIRLNQTTTSADWDVVITADADPSKFLVAFAEGGAGADIRVWAVVMDDKGNGLEGESIIFSATQGSMSLSNTMTGYGGYVISEHNSGVLGNTITVTSGSLPPIKIFTADALTPGGDDWGIAWYDASRLTIWGVITTQENNIIGLNSSYSNPINIYDNSANNKGFNVAGPVGHNMAREIYPLNQWRIAFGTVGTNDEVTLNMGYTTNYPDVFIRVNSMKNSYLYAYASEAANPSVKAILMDGDGIGIEGENIHFSASAGSMSGGPTWQTKFDGTAESSQTGGALNNIITVSVTGYPDVKIQAVNSGGIQNSSYAISWYSEPTQQVNTIMVRYPCYNVNVSDATPDVQYSTADYTSNNKTVSVTNSKENSWETPTYAYIAQGTSAQNDQIIIRTAGTFASDDAIITLPESRSKYLWAFAEGGADPKVWAIVTDENGNGVPDIPIHFLSSGGSMSITDAVTDAAGLTISAQSGGSTGDDIIISAAGIANTITVRTINAWNRDGSTKVTAWYDTVNRGVCSAFVNVPNNILALSTDATFSAVDRTPNFRTFAIASPEVEQTLIYPAHTTVTAGTEGEGDQIWITENTAGADPDAILTLSVPTSEIVSTLIVSPTQVSIGQNINVTMSVFNNGSPDALSVSPTALAVTGNASQLSGPTPGAWATIPGGESRDFTWVYQVDGALSDVLLNGNAFGVDSFTMTGITSTATDSNTVTVQTPVNLSCTFSADQYAEINREFDLTLTVRNAGQATALIAAPVNLTWTASGNASVAVVGNTSPATATIPGGGSQDFTWLVTAGPEIGTLTFNAAAQAIDYNSGNTLTAIAVDSNVVNVIQGLLNLVRTSSSEMRVYQGQKGLAIVMEVQNTSVNPITITASALDFNGSQAGFTVNHAPANPQIAPPQSNFTLNYTVDVLQDAPLGNVVIDGSILWSGEGQNLSADGCAATASWTILKAFNSLRQNYPNPLRLSQQDYTTFDYFVREDVDVTIKIYNLAGELVAKLYDGRPGVGQHTIRWYGDNGNPSDRGKTVGSGVYVAVFLIGEYKEMKKVVVIR